MGREQITFKRIFSLTKRAKTYQSETTVSTVRVNFIDEFIISFCWRGYNIFLNVKDDFIEFPSFYFYLNIIYLFIFPNVDDRQRAKRYKSTGPHPAAPAPRYFILPTPGVYLGGNYHGGVENLNKKKNDRKQLWKKADKKTSAGHKSSVYVHIHIKYIRGNVKSPMGRGKEPGG